MRMKLYELIISEERGLQKGTFLGQIVLEQGKTKVECLDSKLKSKLETLFSEPLSVYYGSSTPEPSGTFLKKIPPNTPEFFKEVFYELRNVHRMYPEFEE